MLTKIKNSILSASIISLAAALCHAAEPLCWERTPNRPAPAQFDTYHGETLDFRCTFTGFGALPFAGVSGEILSESGALAPRLYYQTNGMGAAWWSLPATISSNILAATFPPSADPGAERLTVFFGAPSNAYAAAQVRFRNSPGAMPNNLDPPSVLDWQAELSAATNALWESSAAAFMPQSNAYTKAETDARIIKLAPPGLTTNDVCAIVTNTLTLTAPMRLDGLWLAEGAAGDYQTEAAVIDQSANTVSWKVLDSPDGWFVTWNYAAGTLFDPATDTYSYGVNEMPLGGYWVESDWVADYVDVGPISYTSSTQTVSVTRNALGLARLEDVPSTNGFVTASITNGFVTSEITNGLASATITNGLIGADYIATNNAAFVTAVTNCPVVIADPGDISGWGTYGTVGALLAALAAAITGLRTSKEDASNKVTSVSEQSTDAQYPSAKCVWDNLRYTLISLTQDVGGGYALHDRAVNSLTVQSGVTSLVLVFPPAMQGMARDLIARLDLTTLAAAPEVTIDMPTGDTVTFETEDGAMPEFEAGAVNLVSFTETAAGVIAVAHKVVQEVE